MLKLAYTHAEAEAAAESSAVPKDGLVMQSEGQVQQAPARPSFMDSKRLSQVRRRRSSTNGYDAIPLTRSLVRDQAISDTALFDELTMSLQVNIGCWPSCWCYKPNRSRPVSNVHRAAINLFPG